MGVHLLDKSGANCKVFANKQGMAAYTMLQQ